jgi:hypothetical protein
MLGVSWIMVNEWYFTCLNMHIYTEENYITITEADILTLVTECDAVPIHTWWH